MECPTCDQALESIEIDGLELDSCPSCNGIWFDHDELRQAKDLAEPHADWLDFEIWKNRDHFRASPGEVRCPRCEGALSVLSYGETGVEMDVCPKCRGVWLDHAQLEAIVKALRHEMSSKTFAEFISAALEEAGEILNGPEPLHSEWRDFGHMMRLMKVRLFVDHPTLFKSIEGMQGSI